MEIAKRSRGTPRIANRLLKRVRDYASVLSDGKITKQIADISLQKLEIDGMGLDNIDRKILECIIVNYAGGPVGIETLSSTIGEEVETIEGYKKRNDKIELNIRLNDEIKLLIKNEKQKIVEVPEEKIKKLPVTGM